MYTGRSGVSKFNSGALQLTDVMNKMSIEVTSITTSFLETKDRARIMKAEKAAQHSFKAKRKKRDMAAKVVHFCFLMQIMIHRWNDHKTALHKIKMSVLIGKVHHMPLEGFRIFNCVFGVLIIQLFKTVYGALLIYEMFFLNSIILKQHFFIYYAICLKNYMRYSYEIRHNYLK